MNDSRRRHAHELYATSHEHDQDLPRLERFRNLEPPTAELLGVLIRAAGSRRILELGTSNGYSTIWLADAAEANGGRVVSVDVERARTDLARESLLGAGLEARVELRTQDAGLTLGQSADSAWDFIFLDSERPAYPGYVSDLVRTLGPAGILAVDNVLSHENELVEFTALIEAQEDLAQTVVPVGAGLRLAVRGRSE
jgi:predicted O-methyltransferase YrrM